MGTSVKLVRNIKYNLQRKIPKSLDFTGFFGTFLPLEKNETKNEKQSKTA